MTDSSPAVGPSRAATPTPARRGRLARLVRIDPRDIPAMIWVATLFALAEASVRLRPIAWSADRFGVPLHREASDDGTPASAGSAETIAAAGPTLPTKLELTTVERRRLRAVRRLSPRIYGSERGCLRRSLVLGHVLSAHEPVLRIGVRKDTQSGFSAHAWIEIDGRPAESTGGHQAFDFRPTH